MRKKMNAEAKTQATVLTNYVRSVNEAPTRQGSELNIAPSRTCFGLQLIVRDAQAGSAAFCERRFILSWHSMCRIAFGKISKVALADAYMVHKITISRVIQLVAICGLELQAFQLKLLSELIMRFPPSSSSISIMWDETSEKLSVPIVAAASAAQSASTWEVCVSRWEFAFVVNGKVYTFLAVVPPLPLYANGSDQIYQALFRHPLMEPLVMFRSCLLSSSPICIEINEADGHPANDKLYHWRLQRELKRAQDSKTQPVLMHMHWCSNHANNLVSESLTSLGSSVLINSMYCAALFMRMGGHYIRMIACVKTVVNEKLDWVRCPPAGAIAQNARYWSTLAAYLEDNYFRGANEYAAHSAKDQDDRSCYSGSSQKTKYISAVAAAAGGA